MLCDLVSVLQSHRKSLELPSWGLGHIHTIIVWLSFVPDIDWQICVLLISPLSINASHYFTIWKDLFNILIPNLDCIFLNLAIFVWPTRHTDKPPRLGFVKRDVKGQSIGFVDVGWMALRILTAVAGSPSLRVVSSRCSGLVCFDHGGLVIVCILLVAFEQGLHAECFRPILSNGHMKRAFAELSCFLLVSFPSLLSMHCLPNVHLPICLAGDAIDFSGAHVVHGIIAHYKFKTDAVFLCYARPTC